MPEDSGATPQAHVQENPPVPVYHPVLLALYPVLGLYAHNEDKIPAGSIVRPVLAAVLGAFILALFLRPIYGTRYKAGMAASVLVVAMLSGWQIMTYAMNVVLPWIAGLPNTLYLAAFAAASAAALIGGMLWAWRQQRNVSFWTVVVCSVLGSTYLLADVVFRNVFARGPAWFMAVYAVVVCVFLVWIKLAPRPFRRLTISMNWFGLILLALSVLNILYNRPSNDSFQPPPPLTATNLPERGDKPLPDIYFLVFGGHGRSDVHLDEYNYDETAFLQGMQRLGFTHFPNSVANYPATLLSLTSALNMDYLSSLYKGPNVPIPAQELVALFHNNRVYDFLKNQGYRLHVTTMGTEVMDPREPVDEILRPVRALSEFELVLLDNSALSPFGELLHRLQTGSDAELRDVVERGRIYQVLDRIQELPAIESPEPRFIFGFVPIPEAPFLFDSQGKWPISVMTRTYAGRIEFTGTVPDYREAYNEQLEFTNGIIYQIADRIVRESKRPAVVVIASAHGPSSAIAAGPGAVLDLKERFCNLLLIHIPDEVRASDLPVTESIPFVNVFRVLFNSVFGTDFPELPSEMYMVKPGPTYIFEQLSAPS